MTERVVDTEFVFDRLQAGELSAAYRTSSPTTVPQPAVRSGSEPRR